MSGSVAPWGFRHPSGPAHRIEQFVANGARTMSSRVMGSSFGFLGNFAKTWPRIDPICGSGNLFSQRQINIPGS